MRFCSDSNVYNSSSLFWISIFLLFEIAAAAATTDCMMDDNKGPYDPDNVYQCPTDTKCCIEAAQPSCCKNKPPKDEILDQVLLWGCVIGAAIAVALLICCCRRDSNCCERDKTCKYYVTCGCCRNSDDQRYDDVDYKRFPPPSPTISLKSTKTTTTILSSSNINEGGELLTSIETASSRHIAPK